MILSTALPLIAGRFGLAPTSTRSASAGLKLTENKSAGLFSNDPAGESLTAPCLALASQDAARKLYKCCRDHRLNIFLIYCAAGFTAVDVLALGAFGHAIGVGIVLGLKGTGNL